jgi:hypothetical protein
MLSVIKWLHTHVVTRTKYKLFRRIPDHEREVAEQMLYAILPPHRICVCDKFHILGIANSDVCAGAELPDESISPIYSGVGNDPDVPVQRKGLVLVLRLVRGL